jgi:hypothetical protein
MRLYFAAAAAVALAAFSSGAGAGPAAAPAGARPGFAQTNNIEQVRTVCRDDRTTGRRVCVIDRSQPPTVCHWVRDQAGNLVRDCY